jgi:hypothetical protein
MTSKFPIVPLERTDLLKLIPLTTLTKVAKFAVKSGTPASVFVEASVEAGYTSQGAYSALRGAGYRTRKERSDKGRTLKSKLNRLIEQAQELKNRLAQSESVTDQ